MSIGKGKLFGIGVGPGDPELMTVKAVRRVEACKYIAGPGKIKEETVAYKIAAQMVDGIADKVYLDCEVEMTKDKEVLDRNYDLAAKKITDILDQGEDVAFLTIGDPTVYATYMYIHQRVEKAGYDVEIVSGITSFCAVAAKLNISLSERSEQLHIIPASYQIEEALKLPGNKVLMKAGSKIGEVKEILKKLPDSEVYLIENCGLPNERIFRSADEIAEDVGYLSLTIVKGKN